MNYTIRELRANLKEAFDRADNHEMVGVIRNGVQYYIQTAPMFHSRVSFPEKKSEANASSTLVVEDDFISPYELPPLKYGAQNPKTVEQLDALIDPEQPCCKKNAPCRHWQFNGIDEVWENSLSGRIKEV